MTNDEIGTYPLCEAIEQNPKLKCTLEDEKLIAKVNGKKLVGNYNVIKTCVDISELKINKTLINNKIEMLITANTIMADVFGLSKDVDYDMVYDKDEVWKIAKKLATKENIKKVETKFELDSDDTEL